LFSAASIVRAEVPTRPEITGGFSENFYTKSSEFVNHTSSSNPHTNVYDNTDRFKPLKYVDLKTTHAYIHESSNPPTFYSLTTIDIFYQWTSGDTKSFHNFSGTLENIVIEETGHYIVEFHSIGQATIGTTYKTQLRINGVSMFEGERSTDQFSGKRHLPIFAKISSNHTGIIPPAYDTYSALDRLYYNDGEAVRISEGNDTTIAFTFFADYSGINLAGKATICGTYDGSSGHNVEAAIDDCVNSVYVDLRDLPEDFSNTNSIEAHAISCFSFEVPSPKEDYTCGGRSRLRVRHEANGTAAHRTDIDQMVILDDVTDFPVASTHHISLLAGDVLTMGIKPAGQGKIWVSDAGITIWKVWYP
jgi:hypothetical protein